MNSNARIIFFSLGLLSTLVVFAQANNTCANAITITSDSTCVAGTSQLTGQTLTGATKDGGAIASGCTAVNAPDVWYKFVAKSAYPTITISNLGSGWGTTLKIQLLSGTCGAFTEVACANNAPLTPPISKPLNPGTTYYIRVYTSTTTSPAGANKTFTICVTDPLSKGGRTAEVFSRTILSGANVLNYPWEVTYGPDAFLWITEAKGYKAYRMNPNTGAKTTILDISQGSATTELTTTEHTNYNVEFSSSQNPWPQGGFAGLAIHPQFSSGKPYVYISYVKRYVSSAAGNQGVFFTNYLVRFTYNSGTGKLGSPVTICDTLPGSSDHNSQRLIIAPIGGTYYLFYAQGDMGAGQFGNTLRPNKAQSINSYEGKILRFNLEPDTDAGALDQWIPNTNPFNGTLGVQSAVWATGIRNNQGFIYDPSTDILYGSSHGPFSDDEINIIESGKNYGHPLVEGFAQDGNYNGITAGAAPNMNPAHPSSCPIIVNEVTNAAGIPNYKNPLFSAYPTPTPTAPTNFTTMQQLWNATSGANNIWPSEGWSGLDLYANTIIPGWKRSLVASGLKWGRLIRIKLGSTGATTLPSNLAYGNTGDTVTYFQSTNRYRDLAFAPNGKDIFIITDNSSATSGPGIGNPIVPACPGCVIKYSFLGYSDVGGKSSIPTSIDVADGTANACQTGTTITIDGSNNFLWVPITGQDGNILAEIKANGNNLGTVTSSFYMNTGAVREDASKRLYSNRNITITPQVQPTTPVSVRIYMTAAEYTSLKTAINSQGNPSGITSISDVSILKNTDACSAAMTNAPLVITPQYAGAFGSNYVLQATISSFSTFYLANQSLIVLPLQLLTFTGSLQKDNSALLQWKTAYEKNTSHFAVERSIDGRNFNDIGTVTASGNSSNVQHYSYIDNDVMSLSSAVVYYRLRMIDKDGQYTYSSIVMVYLADVIGKVLLAPNPTNDKTRVSFKAATGGNAIWKLMDNSGRVIMHSTINISKGNNSFTIGLGGLPAGIYYLNVTGAGIEQNVKLQKL